MDLNKAVDNVYKGRERLIILGLTGRTGAGCTTVAKILEKEDITELDIQQCKDYDYKNDKYFLANRVIGLFAEYSRDFIYELYLEC